MLTEQERRYRVSQSHSVGVKLPGYADWSRDITVESGSEVHLISNLEKQAALAVPV